jgi:hypothetical protein
MFGELNCEYMICNTDLIVSVKDANSYGYCQHVIKKKKETESANELYRPSDRRLSAKLVTTFADRECHVVSATNPYGRILGFLDRSRYSFFQVAPQLYPRG